MKKILTFQSNATDVLQNWDNIFFLREIKTRNLEIEFQAVGFFKNYRGNSLLCNNHSLSHWFEIYRCQYHTLTKVWQVYWCS